MGLLVACDEEPITFEPIPGALYVWHRDGPAQRYPLWGLHPLQGYVQSDGNVDYSDNQSDILTDESCTAGFLLGNLNARWADGEAYVTDLDVIAWGPHGIKLLAEDIGNVYQSSYLASRQWLCLVAYEKEGDATGTLRLFRPEVEGGPVTLSSTLEDAGFCHIWAPQIVFSRRTSEGDFEVVVMNVETGLTEILTTSKAPGVVAGNYLGMWLMDRAEADGAQGKLQWWDRSEGGEWAARRQTSGAFSYLDDLPENGLLAHGLLNEDDEGQVYRIAVDGEVEVLVDEPVEVAFVLGGRYMLTADDCDHDEGCRFGLLILDDERAFTRLGLRGAFFQHYQDGRIALGTRAGQAAILDLNEGILSEFPTPRLRGLAFLNQPETSPQPGFAPLLVLGTDQLDTMASPGKREARKTLPEFSTVWWRSGPDGVREVIYGGSDRLRVTPLFLLDVTTGQEKRLPASVVHPRHLATSTDEEGRVRCAAYVGGYP